MIGTIVAGDVVRPKDLMWSRKYELGCRQNWTREINTKMYHDGIDILEVCLVRETSIWSGMRSFL